MTNDVSNWFRYFSNDQNGVLENCLASHTNKNPTAFSPWFFFLSEEKSEQFDALSQKSSHLYPMLLLIEFSLMRNRAVGEFAAAAAILCTFFALRFARTECAQIKVITPTTANDYRFLRLCVVMLWCAVDVLCNFSNCLTLELQKIQSQTAGRKRERAMHHLQCRDFYFDFMSFLSPYSIVKKSVCILRQTVVENDDGGGHLHFLCSSR